MSLNDSTIDTTSESGLTRPVIVINNNVQMAPQGTPVQPSDELMESYRRKLKGVNWMFIAIGAFSKFAMIYSYLNARYITKMIIHGKEYVPAADAPFMSLDFDVMEIFQSHTFYGIFLGMTLTFLGCEGLFVTKVNRPDATHKSNKRSAFKIAMVCIWTFIMHSKGKQMKALIEASKIESVEPMGRNLQAEITMPADDAETYMPDADSSFEEEETGSRWEQGKKKCNMKCPVPAILFFGFIAHFYWLNKFEKAQRDFIAAGGDIKPIEGCPWSPKNRQ
jgi:hypothetical protein